MVVIHLDAHVLQTLAVSLGAGLSVEVRDDHAVDAEVAGQEFIPEAKDVHVIGDAQVLAHLVLLDVNCADDDDNLYVVLELHEHLELTVRLETGEYAAGVKVVEEFAAKLHVQLVAESGDAFLDVFRLDF